MLAYRNLITCRHGDLVYAKLVTEESHPVVSTTSSVSSSKATMASSKIIPEKDPLDVYLEKQDGLIKRQKDPHFCKHAENGMCDHCMPLEPYDPSYLKENGIKHLSFHAYLRQHSASSKNKSAVNDPSLLSLLEMPNYKIDATCTNGHQPWPNGICSKCQPPAITLQRQSFRFVDHIEFASAQMIERCVLDPWRESGNQRFAYLYGKYEPYDQVPLGVKAVVYAIYAPAQTASRDSVFIENAAEDDGVPDDVHLIAQACGLVQVGQLWTDLTDDGSNRGTVLPKRHKDSYYLSSQEAIFAAKMQSLRPRKDGFGSRFVTCVMSGDENGQIGITAYMVSNDAQAMVAADIVQATVDPGNLRRKDPNQRKVYVPEVFFMKMNEYGAKVREAANPCFPVDYWLVNVGFRYLFHWTHMFNLG